MSLFVDASALVAIIVGEPDREELVAAVAADRERLWSPMSGWESVSALQHSYKISVSSARREVQQSVSDLDLRLVPIGADELQIALDAYEQYGKGRHRAALNMGDCFAYACAKTNNVRLLYKGDDFGMTDLA